jgi:uncharacterized membrane protein YjjP (DUF1212 family)
MLVFGNGTDPSLVDRFGAMTASNPVAVRDIVVRVAAGMSDSMDSVASIERTIAKICATQGLEDAKVLAFPTGVIVQAGDGQQSSVDVTTNYDGLLRYDQISALYALIDSLEAAPVDPADADRELNEIERMPPKFSWPVRVFGYSLFSVGFALMLQPTIATVVVCFLLGLLIGGMYLSKWPTLQLVLPVAVSFLVTIVVLIAYVHFDFKDPIRILVPVLVMFLPGAAITIGVIELASNQTVSGASRLISGIVTLLLLAFGIVAAAALMGVDMDVLQDNPAGTIGVWVMVLAIPLYLLGFMFLFCSPWRYFPWLLIVLVVTYLGTYFGSMLFSPQLSGFFGALVMTPVALWFAAMRRGPTALLSILPAFWMIVPGSTGLMAIVGGSESGVQSVLVTVVAIALGVLSGIALFRSLQRLGRHDADSGGDSVKSAEADI